MSVFLLVLQRVCGFFFQAVANPETGSDSVFTMARKGCPPMFFPQVFVQAVPNGQTGAKPRIDFGQKSWLVGVNLRVLQRLSSLFLETVPNCKTGAQHANVTRLGAHWRLGQESARVGSSRNHRYPSGPSQKTHLQHSYVHVSTYTSLV